MKYERLFIFAVLFLLIPVAFAGDISITEITPDKTTLGIGEIESFNVKVKNVMNESVNVELIIEAEDAFTVMGHETQEITLGSGSEDTVKFKIYGEEADDVFAIIKVLYNNTVYDTYSYLIEVVNETYAETNNSEPVLLNMTWFENYMLNNTNQTSAIVDDKLIIVRNDINDLKEEDNNLRVELYSKANNTDYIPYILAIVAIGLALWVGSKNKMLPPPYKEEKKPLGSDMWDKFANKLEELNKPKEEPKEEVKTEEIPKIVCDKCGRDDFKNIKALQAHQRFHCE